MPDITSTTDASPRLYEAMFVVEPNVASDWDATKGMISKLMDRANVELLVCHLWDERKLAYDIKKQKRGTYVLCYFRSDGTTIAQMERDVQLSEHLLRALVLRADHISPQELESIMAMPERREFSPDAQDRYDDSEPPRYRRPRFQEQDSPPDDYVDDARPLDEENPIGGVESSG